jgi:hypothetical protein
LPPFLVFLPSTFPSHVPPHRNLPPFLIFLPFTNLTSMGMGG